MIVDNVEYIRKCVGCAIKDIKAPVIYTLSIGCLTLENCKLRSQFYDLIIQKNNAFANMLVSLV